MSEYMDLPHPELGTTVYQDDGTPIGPITFFYHRIDDLHWKVQVQGSTVDPLIVEIIGHVLPPDGEMAYRLYARPNAQVVVPEARSPRILPG